MGVEAAVGETPSLKGEFVGETHGVPEHTQTHPPRNQQQKGPICLWVAGEVTESWQRAEQAVLFPLSPLPHRQYHSAATWVAPPWGTPKAPPLTMRNRHEETEKNAQMKEQIKGPKVKLSNEEIANLSDAEFKKLVIRMLTEMVEYGHKTGKSEGYAK